MSVKLSWELPFATILVALGVFDEETRAASTATATGLLRIEPNEVTEAAVAL